MTAPAARAGHRRRHAWVLATIALALGGSLASGSIASAGQGTMATAPEITGSPLDDVRVSVIVPGGTQSARLSHVTPDGAHVFFTYPTALTEDGSAHLYDFVAGRFVPAVPQPSLPMFARAVSPDGRSIVVATGEPLVPEDLDSSTDVYRIRGPEIDLVSVANASVKDVHAISDDGQIVLFTSDAQLTLSDDDGNTDVYRWSDDAGIELVTFGSGDLDFVQASNDGERVLVTSDDALAGDPINDGLYEPVGEGFVLRGAGFFHGMSRDGSRVYSVAGNVLDPADIYDEVDAYVHEDGVFTLLTPEQDHGHNISHVDAEQERWLRLTDAPLTDDDVDDLPDLYLVANGVTTLISGEGEATGAGFLSGDGRFVAYATTGQLVPEDVDATADMYLWDAAAPTAATLLSPGAAMGAVKAIGPDGDDVVMYSLGRMTDSDTDTFGDVFLYRDGTVHLLTGDSPDDIDFEAISDDGRRVILETPEQLDPADTDNLWDTYVIDLDTVPPVATVTGPPATTTATEATLDVGTVDDDHVWIDCRLDGGTWDRCSGSIMLAGLAVGTHAFEVRAWDAAGNASEVATASWTVTAADAAPPIGSVAIAGGKAATTNPSVTVSTVATDAGSGMSQVALSNDGVAWTTRSYSSTQPWTLAGADGTKTVHVKWRDQAGNWSGVKSDTILLDRSAPLVSSVASGLRPDADLGSAGTVKVRVRWAATDATSGLARYELAQSVDFGPWTSVSTSLTGTYHDLWLPAGHRYRFQVRAWDKAGNRGAFAASGSMTLGVTNESGPGVTYGGSWSTVSSTAYLNGGARASSAAGATARITSTGRQIAWVSRMGPNRGKADVLVDGVRVATIDLYAPTYGAARVVWVGAWTTSASRVVTIKVLGTSGRPRVDVDAFLKLS